MKWWQPKAVVALILSLAFSLVAWADPAAELSMAEQSKRLLYLHQVLPEVFVSGGGWFVDPMKVIENEHKFMQWYHSPEAQALIHSETPPTLPQKKIKALIQTAENVNAPQIGETGVQSLRHSFDSLGVHYATNSQINHKILELVHALNGQSSQGLITGMIQSLRPDLKATAFKLPAEEKMKFLFEHITDEQLKAGFRTNIYKPEEITVLHLRQDVHRIQQLEQSIAVMALYQEWKQKGGGVAGYEALIEFKPTQNPSGLSALETEQKVDAKDVKKIKETVQSLAQSFLKPHLVQGVKQVMTTKSSFTMELLPPSLAMFRGSLNGDCFTTYAYGYTYAPSERTYIVRDSDGKLLMTVYAMDVKVGGKRSLLLHDMGSSTVNAQKGAEVFQAFYAAKEALGYEQIILGAKGMHHGNFRSTASQAAQPAEQQNIEFFDTKSRGAIGDALVKITGDSYSKGHDMPDSHKSGSVFVPKADLPEKVAVEVTAASFPEFHHKPLSLIEKRNLVLEFLGRGQPKIASVFLGLADSEAIHTFSRSMNNDQRLPLAEYYADVKAKTEAIGLGWDDGVMKENPAAFMRGYLRAPDVWHGISDARSKIAIEYVATLIRQDTNNPDAFSFWQAHPEISATPALEKLFRGFLKDNYQSLQKAKQLARYYQNQPLSAAMIENLYQVFTFQYGSSYGGFAADVLATVKHTPTPEQVTFIQKALQGGLKQNVIKILIAREESWHPLIIQDLQNMTADPWIGQAVQTVLAKHQEFLARMPVICRSAQSQVVAVARLLPGLPQLVKSLMATKAAPRKLRQALVSE